MVDLGRIKREDMALLKKNSTYRVADLFYRRGHRWREDRKTILKKAEYKNSIMYDYLTQKRGERDFKTFRKIVRLHSEKNLYRLVPPNHLVVHMRLGDVMERQVKKHGFRLYSNFYKRVKIKRFPITNVTIVTALHFGHNEMSSKFYYSTKAVNRSWKVIRDFEEQTHKEGLKLELFSNKNVDEDICFMASSGFFVKSRSDISTLAASCLRKGSKVW